MSKLLEAARTVAEKKFGGQEITYDDWMALRAAVESSRAGNSRKAKKAEKPPQEVEDA